MASIRKDDPMISKLFKNETINIDVKDLLEDDRFSYYTWLSLYKIPIQLRRKEFNSEPSANLAALDEKYELLPMNSKMRLDAVRKKISSLVNQNEQLNEITLTWSKTINIIPPFNTLTFSNERLIDWTWRYITRRLERDFVITRNDIVKLFPSIDLNEKYNAILAIHDYFYTHDEYTHKNFCSHYKKAINQKKYREKEDAKPINVQLCLEVKKQLDELTLHYKYSQRQLLEMLISEHHKIIKDLAPSDFP